MGRKLRTKKLVASLLVFALWAGAAWAQPAPAGSDDAQRLFVQIEEILSELSKISGMKPLRTIRHDLIDKARVRQFLEQRLEEVVKPEELRAEELTLKKFGFVPPDFDLAKTTVDLLTEQAAAFYDFHRKKLFVLESAPSSVQQIALVHELAHALADQHFDLEKFIERAKKSDDGAAARMAVMEGQATWLMSEYLARRTGQSLKSSPAIVQLMSRAAEMMAGQFPVFEAAPLYMRETLLFPYTQGMLFQHAVVEKKGQAAFGEVFRHPPQSTQQVLHLDKYFSAVKPVVPKLPSLVSQREYRRLAEGSIGELDHSILLRQYIGAAEAEQIAPRWSGGAYRLLEHKKEKRTVLAYASQWENPSTAREFFQHYQRVLKGKWKTMEIGAESEETVAGRGDDGHFLLRLDGSTVTSLEGMASPREATPSPALH
jgi:hypothetical protein